VEKYIVWFSTLIMMQVHVFTCLREVSCIEDDANTCIYWSVWGGGSYIDNDLRTCIYLSMWLHSSIMI